MTNTDKLTDRKIYAAIVDGTFSDLDIDTVTTWAAKKIAQLDHKAEKAKETAAKKRAEGDELTDVVMSLMNDEYQAIADLMVRIEGEGVTSSKIAYRLSRGVRDGVLEKREISVADDEGHRRKVMGYRLAH